MSNLLYDGDDIVKHIETNRKFLPLNWSIKTKKYPDKCLWCGSSASMSVLHRTNNGLTAIDAKQCTACNSRISRQTGSHSNTDTRKRWIYFIEQRDFEDQWLIQHSNFGDEDNQNFMKHNCIFCTVIAPLKRIPYPVKGGKNILTPTEVGVCSNCLSGIESEFGISVEDVLTSDTYSSKCSMCGHNYLIDKDEASYLGYNEIDEADIQCPKCAFKSLLEEDCPLYTEHDNLRGRYNNNVCDCCRQTFLVDLLMTSDYLVNTHFNYNEKICLECKDGEMFPLYSESLNNTLVRVFKIDTNRFFVKVEKFDQSIRFVYETDIYLVPKLVEEILKHAKDSLNTVLRELRAVNIQPSSY